MPASEQTPFRPKLAANWVCLSRHSFNDFSHRLTDYLSLSQQPLYRDVRFATVFDDDDNIVFVESVRIFAFK